MSLADGSMTTLIKHAYLSTMETSVRTHNPLLSTALSLWDLRPLQLQDYLRETKRRRDGPVLHLVSPISWTPIRTPPKRRRIASFHLPTAVVLWAAAILYLIVAVPTATQRLRPYGGMVLEVPRSFNYIFPFILNTLNLLHFVYRKSHVFLNDLISRVHKVVMQCVWNSFQERREEDYGYDEDDS